MPRFLALLAAAATLAACGLRATAPEPSLEGLPAGLTVEFAVSPGEVGQHAPFTAQLRVTNGTGNPIDVVTAHGCLAIPHVLRKGSRVPFVGSAWGCTAAITTHRFEPGEARSLSWNMRAELYAEGPGDPEGVPAPSGSYEVRAEFDILAQPGEARPAVQRPLRVVATGAAGVQAANQ